MYPDRRKLLQTRITHQRGAGLPMVIFLITVLVLIVATIVQLKESLVDMEALGVQSTRAFYAAETGVSKSLQNEDESASSGDVTLDCIEFTEGGLQGWASTLIRNVSGFSVRISSEGRG